MIAEYQTCKACWLGLQTRPQEEDYRRPQRAQRRASLPWALWPLRSPPSLRLSSPTARKQKTKS